MSIQPLLATLALVSLTACSSHHPTAEPEQATTSAIAPAQTAVGPDAETLSTPSYSTALEAKQNAIEVELEHLDLAQLPLNHWAREWAGTYYTGDGLGMNVSIKIAPNTGVAYTWHGCMGLYDSAFGDIMETFPGGVRIALKTPDKPSSYNYMSDTLYFVRWGDRQYLVPEAQLQSMVNNFNQGGYAKSSMFDIPRKVGSDGHVARYEDDLPPGVPDVPARWRAMLKERVINFKIAHASEPFGTRDSEQGKYVSFRVRLDAGSRAGMFVGMKFDETRNGVWHVLDIDTVNEAESLGTMSLYGAPDSMPESPVGITFKFRDRAP